MQPKTSLYTTIEAGAHHVEYKLNIAGVDIPASYIERLTLEGSLFDDYSPGHCNLRSANMTVQGNYHAGDEVIVYARIANATQQSEWIQFCQLYIFSRELVDETYSIITAYDVLGKTEYQFRQTEIWQDMTFLAAVRSICTTIGATLLPAAESRIPDGTISSDPQSMTAREILQHIAAAAGANWCTRADGRVDLVYVTVPSTAYSILPANTELNTYHQKQTYSAYVGVELEGESLLFRAPSGLTETEWNALKETGRIMDGVCYWATQDMADDILTMLTGATQFSPWSASINLDICAELGDGITIGSISSLYGYYTLDASGGRLFGEIGAHGISNIEYLQQYVPAIERKLVYQGQTTKSSITVLDNAIILESAQRQLADQEEVAAREQSNSEFSQSISQLQVQTDNISSSVQALQDDNTQMQTTITQTANGLEVLSEQIEDVSDYVNGQSAYLRWNGTTATLSIGSSTVTAHTEVRPTGFAVVNGGIDIFLATGDVISLPRGVLEVGTGQGAYAKVGRYKWIDEGSLGFSLMYVG